MEPLQNVKSGIPDVDSLLDHIRCGDNVVFQVSDLEDYSFFVDRFVSQSVKDGHKPVYIRFASHRELVSARKAKQYVLNPRDGFEKFTIAVHNIAKEEGRGAHYIFDCLSELQETWSADLMMGNFFSVVCPYLYSLETVAFFPILRGHHSYETVAMIRDTTQLFLDVYSLSQKIYLHPIKVYGRYSPNMFLPHEADRNKAEFRVLSDASGINRYYSVVRREEGHDNLNLDSWERFFQKSHKAPKKDDKMICADFCRMLVGDDARMSRLFERYYTKEDYYRIRERMIGTGRIGGKSCGILLSRKIIEKNLPELMDRMESHDSFYIGNHVFYTFLVSNNLWELRIRQKEDSDVYFTAASELAKKILKGTFPDRIREKFSRVLEYYGQAPLVVRSSSLLEDGFGNAFAGKYESVFCVNSGTPEERLNMFEDAVRKVYASTMNPSALIYRMKRGLKDRDEQMSILVQRVSGSLSGDYFYPSASGVGYSEDPWNWDRTVNASRGMLRMVAGFATRAVQRTGTDYPRIIHIDAPLKTTLVTREERIDYSQHTIDVIDVRKNVLASLPIKKVMEQADSGYAEAVCDRDTETEERLLKLGKKDKMYYGTCRGFAENREFLGDMERILKTLQKEYSYPVDIEFTVNLFPDKSFLICILQCRPLQILNSRRSLLLPKKSQTEILFSARNVSMGITQCRKIDMVVLVDSKKYHDLPYREKPGVAKEIMELNGSLGDGDKSLMLISPGRVGTSSPELGVPLKFSDLSSFSAIIEYDDAANGFMPELSFGSHLFQDFVESGIFYTALFSGGRHPSILHKEVLCGEREPDRVVSVYDVSVKGLMLWYDMISGKVLCGVPDAGKKPRQMMKGRE